MNSLYYQKRLSRNIGDKFFTSLSVICALIAILPLIFLVTYILIKGGSQITPELFTLEPNPPGDDLDAGGINPALIGTLIITSIASIIAIPVGVGGGIYLDEYSKGGVFLLVLIIYTLFVFSVKAANILENIFTDSIDKTRIKEAAQASLFCAS